MKRSKVSFVRLIIDKIKYFLAKDQIQRIVYCLALIFWTLIMFESIKKYPFVKSSLNISYLTLYMLPLSILVLQIIRNNKIVWALIFGLFSSYILVSIFFVVRDIIERSGNHVKSISLDLKDISLLILIFGFLGLIDWVIYSIKPKRII